MVERGAVDEPTGHRGRPYAWEAETASKLSIYVERYVRRLRARGLSDRDAVYFIAGFAHGHAAASGETWSLGEQGAVWTIERLRDGRGARAWSLAAVSHALMDIEELLEQKESLT